MLPSGRLLVQANFGTALLDYKAQKEFQLPDMPHAVRTYPASGGTALLPLTPQNNWTATVLFCSGMDVPADQWDPNRPWPTLGTSRSCVRLTPDVSHAYEEDDDVPFGRSMGNMILLPTGKIMYLNGAQNGVAGYGTGSNTVGDSYADNPAFQPMIYDPDAPAGKRWSQDGLSPSSIARMYHSSATLLPDGTSLVSSFCHCFLTEHIGSVLTSGSNPHPDVVTANTKFPTEYRVEILYPSYYNDRRPEPKNIPDTLSYGGPFFNITLSAADLKNDQSNLQRTSAVLIRTGFSTHAMNMNQRMLVLETSYTGTTGGGGTLHVSPVPPNAALFPPGPALFFVVVDGTPSVAVQVMVGNGQIGAQPLKDTVPLPRARVAPPADDSVSTSASAAPAGQSGTGMQVQAANTAVQAVALSGLWAGVLLPACLAGVFLLASSM